MPFNPTALRLRPNQPVSRAWDMLLRAVISRLAPLGWCVAPNSISPQPGPPFLGARLPEIELPDTDRAETQGTVRAISAAMRVTNAVIADAVAACRREHDQLARDLGLDRPSVGCMRSA